MAGEEVRQITQANIGYQDFNIIQLRLDTQALHESVKNFLTGKRVMYIKKRNPDGTESEEFTEVSQQIGKPIVNDTGFQNIFSFVVATINPHTVQGNLDEKAYYELLYFLNENLNEMFTVNNTAWGIDVNSASNTIAVLMSMFQLFLSRTIGDKERLSLTPLIKTDTTRDKIGQPGEKRGFI